MINRRLFLETIGLAWAGYSLRPYTNLDKVYVYRSKYFMILVRRKKLAFEIIKYIDKEFQLTQHYPNFKYSDHIQLVESNGLYWYRIGIHQIHLDKLYKKFQIEDRTDQTISIKFIEVSIRD